MSDIPQIPVIANAFANLFAVIEALVAQAKSRAEAELPGSGAHFAELEAKLAELKSKMDVPAIAAEFLRQIAGWLKDGSIVIPNLTDLAR